MAQPSVSMAVLPQLKIWVKDAMYHTFNHDIWICIVSWRKQVGVSQKQHNWLVCKFTRSLRFCIKRPIAFCFWYWGTMADIQEIQEYLWENLTFHNYGLQVELQTLPPLLQDFWDPVSDMFWRYFRWFYAFLQHFVQSVKFTVALLNRVLSTIY